MHSAIEDMLKKYSLNTVDDKKNALKEIVQEITLLGLYRSGFFNTAAFYGGSALRIFYGLNRFSEDLDFSLIEPQSNYDLAYHCKYIKDELASFGFDMQVTEKLKQEQSNIKSAFIKGGTEIHILKISPSNKFIKGVNKGDQLKIKLELDINPPQGADYEVKYHLNPVPFSVRVFSESSLFAGKVHAVLCRKWESRVKGRDFYDYLWYLSRNSLLDLKNLEQRMRQSGHWNQNESISEEQLKKMLLERFAVVDFVQAKQDVIPFIKDPQNLNIWSQEFFIGITMEKLKIK